MGTCEACGGIIGYEGYGTALKPAYEPVWLARKPLIGTVAENVTQYGTGALNIDGCRVSTEDDLNGGAYAKERQESASEWANSGSLHKTTGQEFVQPAGRWPANLIHDGSPEVLAGFPVTASIASARQTKSDGVTWSMRGTNAVVGHTDFGSASRFFYCAKADRADREDGLEGMERRPAQSTGWSGDSMPIRQDGTERKMPHARNHHPTVKPTDLMRYLCRLITPPGGVVLDPFAGSGSTGRGAVIEGFSFIGIEREADYCEIARKRIAAAAAQGNLFHEVVA